jgi:hypothetical protein
MLLLDIDLHHVIDNTKCNWHETNSVSKNCRLPMYGTDVMALSSRYLPDGEIHLILTMTIMRMIIMRIMIMMMTIRRTALASRWHFERWVPASACCWTDRCKWWEPEIEYEQSQLKGNTTACNGICHTLSWSKNCHPDRWTRCQPHLWCCCWTTICEVQLFNFKDVESNSETNKLLKDDETPM